MLNQEGCSAEYKPEEGEFFVARGKDKNVGWFLGFLLGFFYLIFTVLTYFKFKKKFKIENADARVQDAFNFIPLIIKLSGLSCGAFFVLLSAISCLKECFSENVNHTLSDVLFMFVLAIIFLMIFAVISLFAIAYASRIATTQIGVLIYRQHDIFIIPCDVRNATFLEYLKLQWFKDMRNMEVLHLSQILKITRGCHGKMLYVHGTFGTRGIMWRDKRKREECIYALQIACKRTLTDSIAYD